MKKSMGLRQLILLGYSSVCIADESLIQKLKENLLYYASAEKSVSNFELRNYAYLTVVGCASFDSLR
jgi:hypothetical protein